MKYLIPALTIFLTVLAACSKSECVQPPIHEELNSVYYWKTVFQLDSVDLAFLDRHNIGRIYLRMFDVTENQQNVPVAEKAEPNASVKIDFKGYSLLEELTDKEFVPVVYITLDALKAMAGHEDVLASNIVTRVRNMCEYNGIPNVGELQLDCDWTISTEDSFFRLCESAKSCIAELELSWRLSSTIRLHQLSRQAPPVDNGVLMVYNTGNFNDPDATNSIIDIKDVAPYLKHLSSYPLHLDVAYPTYSWQLLFRDRVFVGLMNGLNLADTTQFEKRGENAYIAKRIFSYHNKLFNAGDMVREESATFQDVFRVKRLIEQYLAAKPHSNILYHFDYENLSKYNCDEIESLLSSTR